jgi:putative membrane protein
MLSLSDLPAMNATLNGTSAILLSLGYYFIRQRAISAHKRCMIGAFSTSALFLISYLIYHLPGRFGSVHYTGSGWIRIVYFTILISHTILAAVIVPLVLITLSRAWNARFEKHKRIARWTLPVWFYVSVTGVVIYWMLYQR